VGVIDGWGEKMAHLGLLYILWWPYLTLICQGRILSHALWEERYVQKDQHWFSYGFCPIRG